MFIFFYKIRMISSIGPRFLLPQDGPVCNSISGRSRYLECRYYFRTGFQTCREQTEKLFHHSVNSRNKLFCTGANEPTVYIDLYAITSLNWFFAAELKINKMRHEPKWSVHNPYIIIFQMIKKRTFPNRTDIKIK